MTPLQLKNWVVKTLEDRKAIDLVVLDIKKLTSIADYMVICSGTSNRHVVTMGKHLIAEAKHNNMPPLGVEEEANGQWTLVDLNDVIVHIMLPEVREFYKLEELWGVDIAKAKRNN